MSDLLLCFSTHRPETLAITAKVMQEYDTIILEDPPHRHFDKVLAGEMPIEDHLLELDLNYPEFSFKQYKLFKKLYASDRKIIQVEPYLEHLVALQFFLAEDANTPQDIIKNTVAHAVYEAEKKATGKLIEYYRAVQGGDFSNILTAMNAFAQADAARFVLRDKLRAEAITAALKKGENTYIEAGSIHLLLYTLLKKNISDAWSFHFRSIDREILKIIGARGKLFSPGDILTFYYIFGKKITRARWQQLCSQSIIYAKIVSKEEMGSDSGEYPHTWDELEAISLVSKMTTRECRDIFQQIRKMPTKQALKKVRLLTAGTTPQGVETGSCGICR